MFKRASKKNLWIILVLKTILNLSDGLEYPCRFTAGNDIARWIHEDGSLRFPSFSEGEEQTKVQDNVADLTGVGNVADAKQSLVILTEPVCNFIEETSDVFCKDSIDFNYLKTIKNRKIRTLTVDSYNSKDIMKKNLKKEYQSFAKRPAAKVAAEFRLRDIHIKLTTILDVKRIFGNKVAIKGEIFSNRIIKIGWKYSGEATFTVENNQTSIDMTVMSNEYESGWTLHCRMNSSADYANFEGYLSYIDGLPSLTKIKGNFRFNGTSEETAFCGEFEAKDVNISGDIAGRATKYLGMEITIPKGAFSDLNIRHIMFTDSYFFGDFHSRSFEGAGGLETITFSKCKMEFMQEYEGIFQGSPLKAIYVEDCNTPSLTPGVACNIDSLQLLSFKGSGFLEFTNQSFLWLRCSNLTYLNFHGTNFKLISNDSILEPIASTLRYLDVSYSTLNHESSLCRFLRGLKITHLSLAGLQLKRVPTTALEKVKDTLQYLSLRKNSFEKIPGENMLVPVLHFPKMRSLEELDLQSCRINYIEKRTFDPLPNLQKLDLSKNSIVNLQDGWTKTLPSVIFLNLSYNAVATRAPAINLIDVNDIFNLSTFGRLETLDLSNSNFWNDKTLIMRRSNNLQYISLCKCGLRNISDSFFQILSNVEEMDLSGNPGLGKIFSFSQIHSMKLIQKLHLSNSGIVNLTFGTTNAPLLNLEYLDLSNNYIKAIRSDFFKLMPNLKVLNLSCNSISHWPKNLLRIVPSLESILLDNNKIETLKTEVISSLGELHEFSLGSNPFLCGCYVLDFMKRLRERNSYYFSCPEFVSETEISYYSKKVRGFLRNFLMSALGERRRMYRYRGECSKIIDWADEDYLCYSPSARTLVSFKDLNDSFKECQTEEEHTYFDWICVMAIVTMFVCLLVGFIWWKWWNFRLFTAMLKTAAILGFEEDNICEDVIYQYDAFVSYTDSDRAWVTEKLIPNLEKLENVKICLHERDFQLNEELQKFVFSIDINHKDVIDMKKSVKWDLLEGCFIEYYIKILAVFGGRLSIVIPSDYCRNLIDLKFSRVSLTLLNFLVSNPLPLMMVKFTKRLENRISSRGVMPTKKLSNIEIFRRRVRLNTIGNVDAKQVGTSILENIITSIDKSRCIILVLSQAFVKSQWCQYEMHLAYHRLLETRRDEMILILLENIPRYKRPKTLRYLMKTKTYIEWPSNSVNEKDIETFWNRLLRALLRVSSV